MAPLNDVYSGAYLTLYDTWKSQHKTIADSGFVLKGKSCHIAKYMK